MKIYHPSFVFAVGNGRGIVFASDPSSFDELSKSMDIATLNDLKVKWQADIVENRLPEVFKALLHKLPQFSVKGNIAIQLSKQYNEIRLSDIKSTVTPDVLRVQANALTDSLLELIKILDPEDFIPPVPGQKRQNRTGSVLYAIPGQMAVQRDQQCIVRLAFEEQMLLDDFFSSAGTHIRSLRRIDDRMEVELVDPSETGSFSIRTISSAMQKVERDDYTEWLFFVKPLKAGKFPLYLKVSIILLEDGEKVRKELVLQEYIEVLAELPEIKTVTAGTPFRNSGFLFTIGSGTGIGGDEDNATESESTGSNKADTVAQEAGRRTTSTILSKSVGFVVAGLVAVAGWWALHSITPSVEVTDPLSNVQFVNQLVPSFEKINVKPGIYSIDNRWDTLVVLPSGTTLHVPASIFITLDGQPVTEPVDLHFREFHRPSELLSSGIPMRVKRDAPNQWLQTAGMFEINGTVKNRPVKILPGKSMMVNLISHVNGSYDPWKFDRATENWDLQGARDTSQQENGTPPEVLISEVERLRKLTSSPPAKPPLKDAEDRVVNVVNIDVSDCPRLIIKKTTLTLLYAGKNPSQQKSDLTFLKAKKWYERKLTPTADSSIYTLTLKDKNREDFTILVTPALEGEEAERAKALYRQKVIEFESNKILLAEKEKLVRQQADFKRSLAIRSFGIYNFDKILATNSIEFQATFNLGTLPEEVLKEVVVYLVTGDQRTVIAYPYNQWNYFRFDPAASNYLIAVLPDMKIAYFSPSDFKVQRKNLVASQGKSFVFNMRHFDQPLRNFEDLDIYLNNVQAF